MTREERIKEITGRFEEHQCCEIAGILIPLDKLLDDFIPDLADFIEKEVEDVRDKDKQLIHELELTVKTLKMGNVSIGCKIELEDSE